jgi:hypothetical protein
VEHWRIHELAAPSDGWNRKKNENLLRPSLKIIDIGQEYNNLF